MQKNKLVVVLGTILLAGCGYHRTMYFNAPSAQRSIEVSKSGVSDELGARFELVAKGRRVLVYEIIQEAYIHFVHVYWNTDESVVAVVSRGYDRINFAWDIKADVPIPFDQVSRAVAQSLASAYQLDPTVDALEWASSDEARERFIDKYPHFGLVHHQRR